jgi:hypothetical protein
MPFWWAAAAKPVVGVGYHDPDDIDAVLAQHVQCRHAEMTGTDEGDPHGGCPL